jgi:putative membrane protein
MNNNLNKKMVINKMLSIISQKELLKTFTIFYLVGLTIFIIPFTRELFIFLTPLSLIFVFAALMYNHSKWDLKFFLFSVFVYLSSFVIEAIGVNSGVIFGEYIYLQGLGPKIMGTPLIIGINWLILVYCSRGVVLYIEDRYKLNISISKFWTVIISSSLMVCYDIVLEIVAPIMKMWRFNDLTPPIQNYISWFIISIVFHSIFVNITDKKHIIYKESSYLFFIQILFFTSIIILSYIL